jgi:hypothetical protein
LLSTATDRGTTREVMLLWPCGAVCLVVELLDALVQRLRAFGTPWRPVPRRALYLACAFYGLIVWEAARGSGLVLALMNGVFVPIHEGGHLFFSYFGQFINVAGGTLMQVGVPFALAVYFASVREVQGTAFCAFFFFQQFLPIATYMADARTQILPLITVGDSDFVIHDWNYLFGRLGCLNYDTYIAQFVRIIGWMGMVGTVGWMIWQSLQTAQPHIDTSVGHEVLGEKGL